MNVAELAILALLQISHWVDGAKAVADTKVLDFITELLDSRSTAVQAWTCTILANLASHESTAMNLVGVGVCVKLVALLW